jgi:hypothetical protein
MDRKKIDGTLLLLIIGVAIVFAAYGAVLWQVVRSTSGKICLGVLVLFLGWIFWPRIRGTR